MTYDSRMDTLKHIQQVRANLNQMVNDLRRRGENHDASKLRDPEKAVFDEYSAKLKSLTYGSDEYKACLEGMGVALEHHYAHNDHHPEHFEGGITEMNLMQMTEMLADWYAATKRHDDGDLLVSILTNAERFGYGEEIIRLLVNTANYLGWIALAPEGSIQHG